MKISLYVLALLCCTTDELAACNLFERNLSAAGKDTYTLQATGKSFLSVEHCSECQALNKRDGLYSSIFRTRSCLR